MENYTDITYFIIIFIIIINAKLSSIFCYAIIETSLKATITICYLIDIDIHLIEIDRSFNRGIVRKKLHQENQLYISYSEFR